MQSGINATYFAHSKLVCVWSSWQTQRNLFEILLNQPEIRLYLQISDWFGTKWTSVWFQINRKMVNTIWFLVDLIIFREKKKFCVHDTGKKATSLLTGWHDYGRQLFYNCIAKTSTHFIWINQSWNCSLSWCGYVFLCREK